MTELQNPVQKMWQDQPVEGIKMPVEIVQKRAAKFERRIMWRNVREYVASLIAAVLLGYFLVTAHDLLSRVTFALFIAGMAWIVVQLHRKGSSKSMAAGVDTRTTLRFYRAELERQRKVVTSVWSWYLAPLVPGLAVYTVGYAIKFPRPAAWAGLLLMDTIIAVVFLAIWRINMQAAQCLQRMIDDLNAAEW
jgi:predicted PurR-regulated permease PerM